MTLFILLYTASCISVGWTLCLAAHRPQPDWLEMRKPSDLTELEN
jgi:hypothetical protein